MDHDEWKTYDKHPSMRFSLVPLSLVEKATISEESVGSPSSSALLSLVDRRTWRELSVFVDIELE